MTPIELGTFSWYHEDEGFRRTWYLWGYSEDPGELVAIHLGISTILANARGPLRRSDCTDDFTRAAFALAEQRMREAWDDADDDECEVIDFDDWRRH